MLSEISYSFWTRSLSDLAAASSDAEDDVGDIFVVLFFFFLLFNCIVVVIVTVSSTGLTFSADRSNLGRCIGICVREQWRGQRQRKEEGGKGRGSLAA